MNDEKKTLIEFRLKQAEESLEEASILLKAGMSSDV